MRKLKLQAQISVDGFVAGSNGEMDWMTWDWDEDLGKFVHDLNEPIDLILLGRKMAAGFVDAWKTRSENEETADWFSGKMLDTPKIVFSNSVKNIERENTVVNNGDLVEEITKLKSAEGGDIIVYGGAGFVRSLIKNNLIDEYNLFINPAAIGSGMAIFRDLEGKLDLKLLDSRSYDCGIVVLRYEPK